MVLVLERDIDYAIRWARLVGDKRFVAVVVEWIVEFAS